MVWHLENWKPLKFKHFCWSWNFFLQTLHLRSPIQDLNDFWCTDLTLPKGEEGIRRTSIKGREHFCSNFCCSITHYSTVQLTIAKFNTLHKIRQNLVHYTHNKCMLAVCNNPTETCQSQIITAFVSGYSMKTVNKPSLMCCTSMCQCQLVHAQSQAQVKYTVLSTFVSTKTFSMHFTVDCTTLNGYLNWLSSETQINMFLWLLSTGKKYWNKHHGSSQLCKRNFLHLKTYNGALIQQR